MFCHEEDTPKPCCASSLCRIHLEDLSQSVLLHMTEKLGYKNSDVINTVLSNRASHTLAIYFLLNKKLERYLASLRVRRGQKGCRWPGLVAFALPGLQNIPREVPLCWVSCAAWNASNTIYGVRTSRRSLRALKLI